MEIEEFEAYKKSALGLVSSALRLVGSEDALLAVLEELIPGVLVQKKDEDECVEEAPEEHCDLTEESNIEETSRSDAQINRQPESNLQNETDVMELKEDDVATRNDPEEWASKKKGPQKSSSRQLHDEDMQEFMCKDKLPRFKDIASLEEPKRLLKESIILPSKCPQLFKGVRQPWKAILLYGPPGTGKTELAKAVAGESGACFLLLSPSSLLSKFIGESERLLSKVRRYILQFISWSYAFIKAAFDFLCH
mmetsp:Transcript_24827/g.36421  ORF Transcript_24827/g.36421 Transcript_24827/m.36421 type:complete len:251 (+) Transcript_24827:844-1596(+)